MNKKCACSRCIKFTVIPLECFQFLPSDQFSKLHICGRQLVAELLIHEMNKKSIFEKIPKSSTVIKVAVNDTPVCEREKVMQNMLSAEMR